MTDVIVTGKYQTFEFEGKEKLDIYLGPMGPIGPAGPAGAGGSVHPSLVDHDLMGLATQAELDAAVTAVNNARIADVDAEEAARIAADTNHANTPHGGSSNVTVAAVEPTGVVANHIWVDTSVTPNRIYRKL